MRQRFVLGDEQRPERIDKVLAALLPETSRATVQRWIGEGRVLLDGRACRPRDSVRAGTVIEVEAGPAPTTTAEPEASVEFAIVFEDQDVIVVDKPAGLVVHPARGHRAGTLVNGLLARVSFGPLASDPRDPAGHVRPGIVHRIDKGTSGLLVVAKNEVAREHLKAQLASHRVERVYCALTCGVPAPGTIQTLHARHPRSRLRFTSKVARGRSAVTHVSVREVCGTGQAALVECRLRTGRTHQIRVHLSEQARTPLLGDELYGGVPQAGPLRPIALELGHQALHAAVLGFEHPRSAEWLRFESALPADFLQALTALRALTRV
ncbi:MAG TPA: RluA family pseudouridine synthase [Polyangiaceae bacterium]|nr:RluA family pseudouridine synthase [Polyangiaceae bacterium]